MMLDKADLLSLIRLNELELGKVYLELESEDEEIRNNAGEIVLQVESLAKKLKQLYEAIDPDYSEYPKYEDYINLLRKT